MILCILINNFSYDMVLSRNIPLQWLKYHYYYYYYMILYDTMIFYSSIYYCLLLFPYWPHIILRIIIDNLWDFSIKCKDIKDAMTQYDKITKINDRATYNTLIWLLLLKIFTKKLMVLTLHTRSATKNDSLAGLSGKYWY